MKRLVVACQSEGCESQAKYCVEVKGAHDDGEHLWCSKCTWVYFNPRGFGVWQLLNKTRENSGDPIFTVSIKKFKQPEKTK